MNNEDATPLNRKATRLQGFDYSAGGGYFLTICTDKRKPLLSKITPVVEGLAPPTNQSSHLALRSPYAPPGIILKPCGKVVEEQLLSLEARYPQLNIDSYVIMPNHIHIIMFLENTGGASPSPTIPNIVCAFKSLTSRICKERYGVEHIFQRSFMDHILRNRDDYNTHLNYIINNPSNWATDELHTDN